MFIYAQNFYRRYQSNQLTKTEFYDSMCLNPLTDIWLTSEYLDFCLRNSKKNLENENGKWIQNVNNILKFYESTKSNNVEEVPNGWHLKK